MKLDCTGCGASLPVSALAARQWTCATCGAELEIAAFPALWRPPDAPARAEPLASDSEAACFYHPAKRASVACDGCGRFLCPLCDVEVGGGHFCPACLEAGARPHGVPRLETQRTLWDRIALSVAILPTLLFYVTLITAPIAIFLSIRHWRSPRSLVAPSRWRFVVATAVATVQLIGMTALIVGLVAALRRTGPR